MSSRLTDSLAESRAEARVEHLGDRVLQVVETCGRFARLVSATTRAAFRAHTPVREIVRQIEVIGIRSLTIVVLTALFTGMVLALQTGIALARFGAKPYVGSVIGLSLARELGPVLTALMVGGRVGAGITAEIGSMQVTEQVDAIRSMGANPGPEAGAATRHGRDDLALPLLTVFANRPRRARWPRDRECSVPHLPEFLPPDDLRRGDPRRRDVSGLAKTFVFGWIIAMVACFNGPQRPPEAPWASAGPRHVTVVTASVAVLISDFFLTQLMLAL